MGGGGGGAIARRLQNSIEAAPVGGGGVDVGQFKGAGELDIEWECQTGGLAMAKEKHKLGCGGKTAEGGV